MSFLYVYTMIYMENIELGMHTNILNKGDFTAYSVHFSDKAVAITELSVLPWVVCFINSNKHSLYIY